MVEIPRNAFDLPSCWRIGVCLMYSSSPNCARLLSNTEVISSLSWPRTATTARRIPTPSPKPAPDVEQHQFTKTSCRERSVDTKLLSKPATAETVSSCEASVRSKRFRKRLDRYLIKAWSTFRDAMGCRRHNRSNIAGLASLERSNESIKALMRESVRVSIDWVRK